MVRDFYLQQKEHKRENKLLMLMIMKLKKRLAEMETKRNKKIKKKKKKKNCRNRKEPKVSYMLWRQPISKQEETNKKKERRISTQEYFDYALSFDLHISQYFRNNLQCLKASNL